MADIFKSSFTGEEIEQLLKKAQVLKDVSANPAKVSESNLVKIEIDGVVYSLPPYVSANVQQQVADDLVNIQIGDRVLGLPQIPYIEPNPAQEPTKELNKVKIDSTVYSFPQPKEVEANPTQQPTQALNKIKIDSIVYSLPQPTEQVEANPTDEGTEILSKLKVGNKTYTILSVGAPIEISTEAAMDAVLAGAQIGAVFKYVGTTTSKYENGVLYVVEEEENLIYFTISGISYEAEEGMTWSQWLDTPYNTQGFTRNVLGGIDTVQISGDGMSGYALAYYSDIVPITDTIVPNREYSTKYAQHTGGAG